MVKISIIIPLYNKAKYVTKCLASVKKQTFADFEVIIVNDGSTDNSVEIVNQFQDERIKLINKKNGGPSSARNRGIQEATGDWILFLDADDLLLPFALEYLYNLTLQNSGIDYFCCNYLLQIDGKFQLFSYRRFEGIVPSNFLFEFTGCLTDRPGSAMYRRELLLSHPFNESLRRFEDAEAQYELLNICKVYQSWVPIMISNRDASCAASFRKNIEEDFLGHLVFCGKSFWEKMQLYKLGQGIKKGYPQHVNRYPEINRLDYRLFAMIVNFIYSRKRIKWYKENPIRCDLFTEKYLLENTDYNALF